MPRERWVCLELAMAIDGRNGAGKVELFVDGTSVVSSPVGIDTLPSGGWSYVNVGVIVQSARANSEAWMDDVVIATAPVGCR